MTQVVFDVSAFINSRHVGAVQYGITILCGLMMFLDGFDTQAISYMAPLIAKEWGLSREVLGPIFSSALTGLMVGYLLLSPLSDRFGHRRLIIISTATFALLTLITVMATSVTELIALRFVTGIALGATIPLDHDRIGRFDLFRTFGPAHEIETPAAPGPFQNAALIVGNLSQVRLLPGAGLAPACGVRPQRWRLRLRLRPARSRHGGSDAA